MPKQFKLPFRRVLQPLLPLHLARKTLGIGAVSGCFQIPGQSGPISGTQQSLPVFSPSILLRRNERNSSRKRRGCRIWQKKGRAPWVILKSHASKIVKILKSYRNWHDHSWSQLICFCSLFPSKTALDFSASIGAKSERKGTARRQPGRGQELHFPPQKSSWCWSSLLSHIIS